MRFGIFDHIDDAGLPAQQQLEERLRLLEAYDRLGYYCYHLAEHHGTPLSVAPSPHLFLAAASQRTSRLRLGTLISVLPLYHPMRLIEEVCTLDRLTGGRLDLGVGRGVSPAETSFLGVPGDETQARFEEVLAILRIGLTSDTVDYHGQFHDLDQVPVVVKPVQQPHPPLWFGARSEERARWAAREGLHVMALLPSARVRSMTDAYRHEWAAIGNSPDEVPTLGVFRMIVLAETDAEAMTTANRAFTRHLRNFELLWRRYDLPMPPVYLADTFEGLHRLGIAYAGRPAGAKEFVARERELCGLNYMAIDVSFGDMTPPEAAQSAELFAAEVMPSFND
jgi:alkanesulfonate monooxygenase SsuD/methylene tetrahydromethanopterin reductase-like flavin-dependent oxidoreductase (luciferase family)